MRKMLNHRLFHRSGFLMMDELMSETFLSQFLSHHSTQDTQPEAKGIFLMTELKECYIVYYISENRRQLKKAKDCFI